MTPRLMTGRRRPLTLLTVGLLLGVGLLAWTLPQDAALGCSPAADKPVSLGGQMSGLQDNLKAVTEGLAAGKPATELIAHVSAMQDFALAAKSQSPGSLKDQPDAKRAAYKTAFRAEMLRLMIELAHLELDLIEGRTGAASARLAGSVSKIRDSGHDKF